MQQQKKFKIRFYIFSKNSKRTIQTELQKIFPNVIPIEMKDDIISLQVKFGFKDIDYSNKHLKCFEIESYEPAVQLYKNKKRVIQNYTFFQQSGNDNLLTAVENKIIDDVAKSTNLELSYNRQLYLKPPTQGIGTFITTDNVYLIIFYNGSLKK